MDSKWLSLGTVRRSSANVLYRTISKSIRQNDGRARLSHWANTAEDAHSKLPLSRETERLFRAGVRSIWRSVKTAVKFAMMYVLVVVLA